MCSNKELCCSKRVDQIKDSQITRGRLRKTIRETIKRLMSWIEIWFMIEHYDVI